MRTNQILISAVIAAFAIGGASCSSPKNVTYFEDAASVVDIIKEQPIRIKPGDKLAIIVKTKDAAMSSLFNQPVYATRISAANYDGKTPVESRYYSPTSAEGLAPYTVSPAGTIDFPVLGNLKVEGMTRSELAGYIKGELAGRDLLKDANINVEFVNTGVNILGEVNMPGRYDVNLDKFTVLDAIALAGDLTITGLRENVAVIRQVGDKAEVYRVDLTDLQKTMSSPAYYLQQNDVIYVEPNSMRKRETSVNGNSALSVSFWISVASLITTAVTTIGVFVKK